MYVSRNQVRMDKFLIYFFGLFIYLVSCGDSNESSQEVQNESVNFLTVEYLETQELSVGDEVKSEGITIGKVTRIEGSCSGHRIYATVELIKGKQIPHNSEFKIITCDILGNKCIEVKYSNSEMNYAVGDTVIGLFEPFETDTMDLVNKLVQITDSSQELTGHLNQDSLRKIMDSTLYNSFPEYKRTQLNGTKK